MVALPANLRHPGMWRTQSNVSERWGKCGSAIQGNVMRDATFDERARILDLALYKCILKGLFYHIWQLFCTLYTEGVNGRL